MTKLTAERLRELLEYDPETGVFTRRVGIAAELNGAVAGTTRKDGRRQICVDYSVYLEHRLAFLYMTGTWPPRLVDHIDGNPSNNRWENLRAATNSQNGANAKTRTNNTSGLKGVSWSAKDQAWRAYLQYQGRHLNLGAFPDPQSAHKAYCDAARGLFGQFARTV